MGHYFNDRDICIDCGSVYDWLEQDICFGRSPQQESEEDYEEEYYPVLTRDID